MRRPGSCRPGSRRRRAVAAIAHGRDRDPGAGLPRGGPGAAPPGRTHRGGRRLLLRGLARLPAGPRLPRLCLPFPPRGPAPEDQVERACAPWAWTPGASPPRLGCTIACPPCAPATGPWSSGSTGPLAGQPARDHRKLVPRGLHRGRPDPQPQRRGIGCSDHADALTCRGSAGPTRCGETRDQRSLSAMNPIDHGVVPCARTHRPDPDRTLPNRPPRT